MEKFIRKVPMMVPILEMRKVSKQFGAKKVIRKFSLELQKGRIGCLLGPSGCGKTTALRTIAGFEIPDAGEIHINGNLVSTAGRSVPPEARRIGCQHFIDECQFAIFVQTEFKFGVCDYDTAF